MVACAVRCQLLVVLLLVAIPVALTDCAGTSKPGAPQGAADPDAAALLPAGSLPPLPVDREASAVIVKELLGEDVMFHSAGANPDGEALKLNPGAEAPAWGIWRFYAGLEYLQSVEVVMTVDVGAEAYIALADYGLGAWVFDGPLSAGKSIALDDGRHKSPAGHCYVGVVVLAGTEATVEKLKLTTESGWLIVTVEASESVGSFSSLAVVDGRPAISYRDQSNHGLKYVRASDPHGAAWDAPQLLDDGGTGGDVGSHTSLAVVDGHPAITYYDIHNCRLMYVRALDAQGDGWATPQFLDAGGAGPAGWHTSLAIVDGRPAVSYTGHDSDATCLRYMLAADAAGDAWHLRLTLDSGVDAMVGYDTSLALVDGCPAVSYYDLMNKDLKYIQATDAIGDGWGTPEVVDTGGVGGKVGRYTSLAVVAGQPAISYYNEYSGNLKYARRSDAQPSQWQLFTVDGGRDVGLHTSLAVVDGAPAISYQDRNTGSADANLRYAQALTATGTGSWHSLIVDTGGAGGDVGYHTSLAVVDGKPAISYWDQGNSDLKYAIRLGPQS